MRTLAVLLLLALPATAQSVLDKPLDFMFTPAPKQVYLTEALKALGGNLRTGFVIFGIELQPAPGSDPAVIADFRSSPTFGDAVNALLRQTPNYDYERISEHFASIFPKGAKDDPDNPLNLRVPRFDVEGIRSGELFSFPDVYIPELRSKLHPPVPGQQQIFQIVGGVAGPKVTLHLRDVTVREILNAAAVASEGVADNQFVPVGWLCILRPDRSGQLIPKWQTFYSFPPDWRKLGVRR